MAGRGGLNLTHGEPLPDFLNRYREAKPHLAAAITDFSPDVVRAWSAALGQPTFIGSSGRVFPNAMKASPLLRAWLRRLDAMGVRLMLRHRWTGWQQDGRLVFQSPVGEHIAAAAASVLALGGASWPRLGSDAAWVKILEAEAVRVAPLKPANGGFEVAWSDLFRDRFEGRPLKNIALSFGPHTVRGEAVITRAGIEGGAVYALSAELREAIADRGYADLRVALLPDCNANELMARLSAPRGKQSLSNWLRKVVHLSPAGIGLLQEAAIASGVRLAALSQAGLAERINAVPVRLHRAASIARAISSAGGIGFDELDANFMLRRRPGVFVAGEMLDWEAPTGGYLLQACFATGAAAANGALRWLGSQDVPLQPLGGF